MNRRKAKKRIKKRFGLDGWVAHAEPRKVETACLVVLIAIRVATDKDFARAIGYEEDAEAED